MNGTQLFQCNWCSSLTCLCSHLGYGTHPLHCGRFWIVLPQLHGTGTQSFPSSMTQVHSPSSVPWHRYPVLPQFHGTRTQSFPSSVPVLPQFHGSGTQSFCPQCVFILPVITSPANNLLREANYASMTSKCQTVNIRPFLPM